MSTFSIDQLQFANYIFDLDSTLVTIEGIDELARMRGLNGEITLLTKQAMAGKLRLEHIFSKRLELVRPTRDDLKQLSKLYCSSMLPQAREVITRLKSMDKQIFLLTAGFSQAIEPVAQELGIPKTRVYANRLQFNVNGDYSGYNRTISLWRDQGKAEIVKRLRRKYTGSWVVVGDGMNDLLAAKEANAFVQFTGVVNRTLPLVELPVWYKVNDLKELV